MTANAVIVPIATAGTTFWDRFRRLAEQSVSEGTIVAGERLWELVPSSDLGPQLTIRSTRYDADRVECWLDLESGTLTCTPGSAIEADRLRFQLLEGTCGKLRRDGVECTIDQAVASILDELVWIENGDCDFSGGPDSEGN